MQKTLKLRLTGFHTYCHFVNVMNMVTVRASNPGFTGKAWTPSPMYNTQHVLHKTPEIQRAMQS